MAENLYNYITEQPQAEAIDDGLLFNLLIGNVSLVKGGQWGLKLLNNVKRVKSLQELNSKRKDWGIAYRKYSGNPQGAIDKLLETQNGFVPNAINREGGIDLVWGEYRRPKTIGKKGGGYGLAHIIGRRDEEGNQGIDFIKNLPELLENGNKYTKKYHKGRFYYGTDDKEAVIRTDFNNNARQWLDSAYFKK